MAKVSITQAAKLASLSRSYFYKKYINTGIISVISENGTKLIDTSELIRVCGSLSQQHDDNKQEDTVERDKIVSLLESQLRDAKEQIKKGEERELWLMQQLEKTTHLLEDKTAKKRKKFLGIF